MGNVGRVRRAQAQCPGAVLVNGCRRRMCLGPYRLPALCEGMVDSLYPAGAELGRRGHPDDRLFGESRNETAVAVDATFFSACLERGGRDAMAAARAIYGRRQAPVTKTDGDGVVYRLGRVRVGLRSHGAPVAHRLAEYVYGHDGPTGDRAWRGH